MGTVFAPTFADLTMAYHEIQVYFVIKNTLQFSSKQIP